MPKGKLVAVAKAPIKPQARFTTVGSGLKVPWALAFAPDGRAFFTERAGRVRVIQKGKLLQTPWCTLSVMKTGEMGLLGIALSPEFSRTRHVYVVGTFRSGRRF